jgi:hypothetical protein
MEIASSRPQAAYDPQLSRDDDPFSQSPMDLLLQLDSDHDSLLTRSVRMSLETYTSKMETLIWKPLTYYSDRERMMKPRVEVVMEMVRPESLSRSWTLRGVGWLSSDHYTEFWNL